MLSYTNLRPRQGSSLRPPLLQSRKRRSTEVSVLFATGELNP